jgi:hypothetical protein
MTTQDWALAGVNAAMCTLLLRASAAKLVSPAAAAGALREVLSGGSTGLVRVVAAVEAAIGLAVAIPVLRQPDQVLVGMLGCSFFVLGAVGKLRGSRQPCGCLGTGSTRPLGTGNMLWGLALLVVAFLNIVADDVDDAEAAAAGTAFAAVIMSVGWLFWTHQRQVRVVVANARGRTESLS